MRFYFYRSLRYETNIGREEFVKRLNKRMEFSKAKNFFNAFSDDFPFTFRSKGDQFVITKRFEKQFSKIVLSLEGDSNVTVHVFMRPVLGVYPLMLLLILCIAKSWAIVGIFLGIASAGILMGFCIDVLWVDRCITKKLLVETGEL